MFPPQTPKRKHHASPQPTPPSPYAFIGRLKAPPYVFRNTTPTPSSIKWVTQAHFDQNQYNIDYNIQVDDIDNVQVDGHGIDDDGDSDSVEVLREVTREEMSEKIEVVDLTGDDEMMGGRGGRKRGRKQEEERYIPPGFGGAAGRVKNGWTEEQERAIWLGQLEFGEGKNWAEIVRRVNALPRDTRPKTAKECQDKWRTLRKRAFGRR